MNTRQRILDEAERLIAQRGIEELRLRDIAEALGIRVPSIYGHCDGREGVYAGLVERYTELIRDQFPYDGNSDPAAALLDGMREYVRVMVERPAFARLELRDLERARGFRHMRAQGVGVGEDLYTGPHAPLYRRVEAILERGHALGQFRKIDVVWFFRVLGGTMLASLTWPDQALLFGSAADGEFEPVMAEIQDLVLRYVRAD